MSNVSPNKAHIPESSEIPNFSKESEERCQIDNVGKLEDIWEEKYEKKKKRGGAVGSARRNHIPGTAGSNPASVIAPRLRR